MNNIKIIVNKDTNYVFHMLSVSKCGYDNDYGKKYAFLHSQDDLKKLKDNASHITVEGGKHWGILYGLLVSIPASLQNNVISYYSLILNYYTNKITYEECLESFEKTLKNNNHFVSFTKEVFERFNEYRDNIIEICNVMINNYQIFEEKVWPDSFIELKEYAAKVQSIFDNMSFCDLVEKHFNNKIPSDFFGATLCNSLAYGAEAIDISDEYDVFGIDRSPEYEALFIAHEYIVYVMMGLLENFNVSRIYNNWVSFEALAEFYLEKILGKCLMNQPDIDQKLAFYKEQYALNNSLTIVELYELGLKS